MKFQIFQKKHGSVLKTLERWTGLCEYTELTHLTCLTYFIFSTYGCSIIHHIAALKSSWVKGQKENLLPKRTDFQMIWRKIEFSLLFLKFATDYMLRKWSLINPSLQFAWGNWGTEGKNGLILVSQEVCDGKNLTHQTSATCLPITLNFFYYFPLF